ncbi:hypothetical protein NEFER03_0350 [Nematocida sp. LUAm3]|nr:hypothetical protein NEFER03_0350 [Nematocida sp. LUAm3]KAI5178665.1 hypothetical protein NEFER01_1784 [Nematocida sp. LUAm1]
MQHLVFPRGHPSQYYQGCHGLNFGDRTGSGAYPSMWPHDCFGALCSYGLCEVRNE